LTVKKTALGMEMNFPAVASETITAPEALLDGLGAIPVEVRAAPDYLAVFESEHEVAALAPDFSALSRLDRRGVIATASGSEFDFVSRCFYPKLGVDEDPVTGSRTARWHRTGQTAWDETNSWPDSCRRAAAPCAVGSLMTASSWRAARLGICKGKFGSRIIGGRFRFPGSGFRFPGGLHRLGAISAGTTTSSN
jgi:hypothetical protein